MSLASFNKGKKEIGKKKSGGRGVVWGKESWTILNLTIATERCQAKKKRIDVCGFKGQGRGPGVGGRRAKG